MPKNPLYADKVVLKNGGVIETEAGTDIVAVSAAGAVTLTGTEDIDVGEIDLTDGNFMVGNGSGEAADVSMSGDASLANTGAVTVTGANAAFNVGTNLTMTKEVNHTINVVDTTTAATAGGNLTVTGAAGSTTGAGGPIAATAGAGGNNTGGGTGGAGGASSLTAGAGGTEDTGTGGAGGASSLVSGVGGATSGAGGVGGAGGAVSVTAAAGGADSEGASGTGGEGGTVSLTSGAGGAGNTTGVAGAIRLDSGVIARKQGAPAALTTTATLTAAQMLGGMVTASQGASGAATYTTLTGTQLDAALPSTFAVDDSFDLSIINISTDAAEDVTLAVDTGITAVGNLDVQSNDAATSKSAGLFRFRKTAANTFVVYRIG